MSQLPIYVVNFKNEARRQRMSKRIQDLGLYVHYVDPVSPKDPRLVLEGLPNDHKRTCSIMLQHLDSLTHFVKNTDATHCIVCEDDIKISKDLVQDLPEILGVFKEQQFDVLLLGFLYPHEINPDWNPHFPRVVNTEKYQYLKFPDDIWGSQMYLMSREHAQKMINKFTPDYTVRPLEEGEQRIHYNPDWILTKQGNRALIYPMLAVEEGDSPLGDCCQSSFHKRCYIKNYREGIHY